MDNKTLLKIHTLLNDVLNNDAATREELIAALEAIRHDVIQERCERFGKRFPHLVGD